MHIVAETGVELKNEVRKKPHLTEDALNYYSLIQDTEA